MNQHFCMRQFRYYLFIINIRPMKMSIRFFTVILLFHVCVSGIARGGIKWTPDDAAYYAYEKGMLVKYQLPSYTVPATIMFITRERKC
jgi:hypothetical protein